MSTTPPFSTPFLHEPSNSDDVFKQFFLETERLQLTYSNLEERFKAVHLTLHDSHTRLSGKLAELDFMSRYLETILQHISQGIIFIDIQGIVTTYNQGAQQILQIPETDLLFHHFTDFFDDQSLGFSLKEAFHTQKCPNSLFIFWEQKGHTIELEIESTFVAMGQQKISLSSRQTSAPPIQGLLVLLRDITKLRRLQQAASRNDRLKELGEIAAHLAHEIRNPLGGIKGFASLLQQDLQDRPDLQQMAQYIAQGADGLNLFVSNVLQYARPFHLQIETIDLLQLIEEVRQLVQADPAWNSQIRFSVRSASPTLFVSVDPQLFKSTLLNLFLNALQAMPVGGDLFVTLEMDFFSFILKIEDTGIGISPENIPKIFSPFFTTKATGNGLGLAEVQKVIQAHQGWIDVKSEEGKGTVFTIKIPLKLAE